MCLHMACFNKQKIEALKLKFSITFKRQQFILLPLESYENFCFSIFTYGRGFPRPFCSFPSTMCLHMACFNKQKIEALKLKFSITFKRQQYIPRKLQKLDFEKKYNRILGWSGWSGWGIFSVFFLYPDHPNILLYFFPIFESRTI